MRLFTAVLLVSFAGLIPAYAQDRTPPAGSYRALEVPADQAPAGFMPYAGRGPVLNEGRSVDERAYRARVDRDIDR